MHIYTKRSANSKTFMDYLVLDIYGSTLQRAFEQIKDACDTSNKVPCRWQTLTLVEKYLVASVGCAFLFLICVGCAYC